MFPDEAAPSTSHPRWLPQVDPWTFNATRGLGMGLALLLWMAWEYRLGAIRLFTQSDPRALAISGGFFALGSSMYILALQLSSITEPWRSESSSTPLSVTS